MFLKNLPRLRHPLNEGDNLTLKIDVFKTKYRLKNNYRITSARDRPRTARNFG